MFHLHKLEINGNTGLVDWFPWTSLLVDWFPYCSILQRHPVLFNKRDVETIQKMSQVAAPNEVNFPYYHKTTIVHFCFRLKFYANSTQN
jgi:hypothetical protein